MSIDTIGRLRGFISSEQIAKYLQTHYDKNAFCKIERKFYGKIDEEFSDTVYAINLGSQDNDNWYVDSGFIEFKDEDETRQLFYSYSNVNFYENLEYYQDLNLEEMVSTETTSIILGCFGNSVEILKNMIEYFNGGWLDKNDCDDELFEYIPPLEDVILGGIYKYKEEKLFVGTHFILIDTDDGYRCVDIDIEENSNKAANIMISYLLRNNILNTDDFWSVDSAEDILISSDGYLGVIPIPLVRELKKDRLKKFNAWPF